MATGEADDHVAGPQIGGEQLRGGGSRHGGVAPQPQVHHDDIGHMGQGARPVSDGHTRVVGPRGSGTREHLEPGVLQPAAHSIAQVWIAFHQKDHAAPLHLDLPELGTISSLAAPAPGAHVPSGPGGQGRCAHVSGAPQPDAGSMFVRYYLELALPFEGVEKTLLSAPQDWVPGLAEDAEARGQVLLAEVGFGPVGLRLDKRVAIELGEPFRLASKSVLPMAWRATGPHSVFPSLEADIEVAPLGESRTQLSVSARYRPPLGPIGRVIDRTLLHRVAEATIKDFVDRAGEALVSRAVSVT
jgi:hypothetical protein